MSPSQDKGFIPGRKGGKKHILVCYSERGCLFPKIYCAVAEMNFNFFVLEAERSVASHVALRCFCYYHCAKTIYYSRVPGHKVKERGMNFLLRHAAKANSAMDKTNNNAPQERIRYVDSEQIIGKE